MRDKLTKIAAFVKSRTVPNAMRSKGKSHKETMKAQAESRHENRKRGVKNIQNTPSQTSAVSIREQSKFLKRTGTTMNKFHAKRVKEEK